METLLKIWLILILFGALLIYLRKDFSIIIKDILYVSKSKLLLVMHIFMLVLIIPLSIPISIYNIFNSNKDDN